MTEWPSKIQNTQIQIPFCIKLPTTFFFTLTKEMLIYFPSDAVLTLVEMVAASPDLEGIKPSQRSHPPLWSQSSSGEVNIPLTSHNFGHMEQYIDSPNFSQGLVCNNRMQWGVFFFSSLSWRRSNSTVFPLSIMTNTLQHQSLLPSTFPPPSPFFTWHILGSTLGL